MNAKCKCNQKIDPPLTRKLSSISQDDSIEINFGSIPFNNKKTKEVLLDLGGQVLGSFTINLCETKKYDTGVFQITPAEEFHKPNTELKLKCTYHPSIAFQTYCQKFTLTAANFAINLTLLGESTGPILTVSTTFIKFFQDPKHKMGRAVVEIRNTTDVPAPFKIEIDSKQKLFSVSPLSGVCNDLTFVAINFNPPDHFGAFSQQLDCLVYGNQPIIIRVLGVYSKRRIDPETASIVNYPFSFEEKNGYKGCFRDSKEEKDKHPVTLSTHYLDLGRASVKEVFDDVSTVATKNFKLTNNLEMEVIVDWIEEDKVFSIFPKRATVAPGDCMFYKCVFTPIYSETCYNRMFTAQVYWKPHNIDVLPTNENVIIVPLTISINLQGDTYKDGQTPLAHLEFVPNILEFPPCLPLQDVYENFKIMNRVSHPIMFKMVPPEISNIVMMPMAGMIRDFVVILAKLRALRKVETLNEQWYIILNGQNQKKLPFKVTASSEIPSICIGKKNEIRFELVQVETLAAQKVFLENTSNYNIRFQFSTSENKFLSIDPLEGLVQMCKKIPINFSFKASYCSPRKMHLVVQLYVQQKMNQLVGPKFEHNFTVFTNTTFSQLTATPLTDEFYLVEYDTIINTSFHVSNFGISTIFFKIHPYASQNLKIDPIVGQVAPRERFKINLTIECKTLGKNCIGLEYYNRIDATSDKHTKEAVPLLEYTYECETSILKITEIIEHTFGPLFSKRHFWNFLYIDKINEMLNHMRPGQTESLNVDLPECVIGSHHYITFVIENDTDLDTKIILKRKKLCNCGFKQKPSAYRTEYALDCVHRDTIFMGISQAELDRRSSQKITIDVSYMLPGATKMAYEMYIRPSRTIILYFSIYGIPERSSRVSVYKPDLYVKMFGGVLAARKPPGQITWFYNNSNIAARISIDQTEANKLNDNQKFKVFEFVYDETYIKPKGLWPMLIIFNPTEMRKYSVTVNINMNDEIKVLTIEGYGVLKPFVQDFFELNMRDTCLSTHKFPLKISKDHLTIKCLPTWYYTETIIFLVNLTKSKLIYYEWADLFIEGIIKIIVREKSGILRPQKSRPIMIRVESYNQSVLGNFVLNCSVMDLQFLYAHKKVQAIKERIEKQKIDEFQFCDYPVHYKMKSNTNQELNLNVPSKNVNYVISVNIRINIVDTRDLHLFLDESTDIFTFNLPESLSLEVCTPKNKTKPKLTPATKCPTKDYHDPLCLNLVATMFEKIFEKVITDVLFDENFPQVIATIFEDVPLYYSQINLDDRSFNEKRNGLKEQELNHIRKTEVKKFCSRPPTTFLTETFKSLIQDVIYDIFDLASVSEQQEDEKIIQTTMEHLSELCTLQECECPSQKI